MLPKFKDKSLLITALTHRSALNEKENSGTTARQSNERLEFLGDAVLELATTRFLFHKFPKEPEGVLTAFRSALVKTTTLAEMASDLKLGEKLFMSKGEEATGGRENESLLADAVEALIGAIYLDQGFEKVEVFLSKKLFPKFAEIKKNKLYKDAKSLLQEEVQAQGQPTPVYKVVKELGPDHDKEFTVDVVVGAKVYGSGIGKSKQLAQQQAARKALEKFS
ncbi:MAG: ribonuclease III [Candidatus Woesebacteria bacterium]|jgi:ribonuclease-3